MGIQIGRLRFFKHGGRSKGTLAAKWFGSTVRVGPLIGSLIVNTPWFFGIWVSK